MPWWRWPGVVAGTILLALGVAFAVAFAWPGLWLIGELPEKKG